MTNSCVSTHARVSLFRTPTRANSARVTSRCVKVDAISYGRVSNSAKSIAAATALATMLSASLVHAKPVEIAIDASTIEQSSCGMAGGVPGSGTYKAKCILLSFKAFNPTKDVVYNADVFGSVKDQANDDVLNSGRIGSIKELQPGENDARLELTVGASQPLPLKLKAFKGRGTTEKLSMSGNPYDYEDILAYDSY